MEYPASFFKGKARREAPPYTPTGFSVKQEGIDMSICPGCGRPELHKMCPAWGTPLYMSGKPFTKEDEEKYKEQRQAAMEESAKRGNSCLE